MVPERISEREIQTAFEQNLQHFEEGLTYIGSFVPVGTGVVDTLALDDENNPVIIEYKKPGQPEEDALIQLMDYYSWFISDENHQLYLRDVIQKKKPEVSDLGELRLIGVVDSVNDRVKHACWALEPETKLVSYSVIREGVDSVIVPTVVLDTSVGGERLIKAPKSEDDHLKDHENLKDLYYELRKRIMSDIDSGVKFNPSPQDYIGVSRRKMFLGIHFKKKWIRLDVILKPKEVGGNPKLIEFGPNSDWSYIHLEAASELDSTLMSWLKMAYDKAG